MGPLNRIISDEREHTLRDHALRHLNPRDYRWLELPQSGLLR